MKRFTGATLIRQNVKAEVTFKGFESVKRGKCFALVPDILQGSTEVVS